MSPVRFRAILGPLLACALAVLQGLAMAQDQPFEFARTPGRLPKTVIPVDYQLRLRPRLDRKTFAGTVEIRVRLTEATPVIVLNALDLDIRTATLEKDGAALPLVIGLDQEAQQLTLTAPTSIAPGEGRLTITYGGTINAQAQGLYYDRYPTPHGEKVLLGTDFEPANARRLLPCWDEPVFRARFQLTVELPRAFEVFSNMPVESATPIPGPGLTRTTFAPTPPMASYLLVLVAGELERIADTQDGTEIGVVFTEGKRDAAAYALASAKQLLHYYNEYFGVRFPLPKLDHFAIPGGFSGAMENWGGITYNETSLLYDPRTSPPPRRQAVFGTIAHEMAHQWFGDLVTNAWWDDLWLNEGFASWMGAKATARFNPDWDGDLDQGERREHAMALDARATSHPIQQAVTNESDADDAFDDITYVKGSSFLRMLEDWLGPDTFQAGIRRYVEAHAYASATTADLWQALAVASGQDVAAFASAWTRRPGFPLIGVASGCGGVGLGPDGAGGAGWLALTQRRFRADPETRVAPLLWPVPLTFAAPGRGPGPGSTDPPPPLLMTEPTDRLPIADCVGVTIVDPEARGYYRLAYAPADRARLVAAFPGLPAPARLKLLQDTWALVVADDARLADYLQLTGALGDEPKRAVWRQVAERLRELDRLLGDDPLRPAFRQRAYGVLGPELARLGWTPRESESEQTASLRADLIGVLGDLDEPTVVATARQRFQSYLVDPASLPPSLIDAVTHAAGRHADAATYDILLSRARQALTTEEQERYYAAVESASDPQLATRALALSLDPATPELLSKRVVANVAAADHVALAWRFAKAHGDALLARATTFERNGYLGAIAAPGADPALADDLVAYARVHLPTEAQTETGRTADAIRLRARMKARLLPQLRAALQGAIRRPLDRKARGRSASAATDRRSRRRWRSGR